MNWERVDNLTLRAKIRGGWLVKSYESQLEGAPLSEVIVSMCFVPDPMHSWQL